MWLSYKRQLRILCVELCSPVLGDDIWQVVFCVELEWMLAGTGAIETQLESAPGHASVTDVMMSSIRQANFNCTNDNDDSD